MSFLKDLFGKEDKKKEENKNIDASGIEAIDKEFQRIYPDQNDPKNYATLLKWKFGGNDPLDIITIYEGVDYWHFVTYGLSELYEKVSNDKEYSGYGMEFTFKMKKGCFENEREEEVEIKGICGILQSIARVTFENGSLFLPYQYVYTGQKTGIDTKSKSLLTGFITIPDTLANTIDTPNGKVEFVEFIAATDSELTAIMNKELTVKELYEKLGTDITDFNRKSIF